MNLFLTLIVLYVLASVLCFAMFAFDKRAAVAGRRRLSERSLLWSAAACGWPGGWLAQRWLHHKSSKPSFRWRFLAAVVLNVVVTGAVVYAALYIEAYLALS